MRDSRRRPSAWTGCTRPEPARSTACKIKAHFHGTGCVHRGAARPVPCVRQRALPSPTGWCVLCWLRTLRCAQDDVVSEIGEIPLGSSWRFACTLQVHRPQITCKKEGVAVSSISRFQRTQLQQYSANLSLRKAHAIVVKASVEMAQNLASQALQTVPNPRVRRVAFVRSARAESYFRGVRSDFLGCALIVGNATPH